MKRSEKETLPGKYVAIEKLCIYYLQAVGSLILGTTSRIVNGAMKNY